MFEDQNQNNQQVPNNLPFGQPQSPFVPPQPQANIAQPAADYNQSAQPVAQPGKLDDMFAETDQSNISRQPQTGYAQNQYIPNQFPQPGVPNYYQAGASPMTDDLFGRRGFPWGKVITVLIIILVVAIGAGAAYWGYGYFTSSSSVKPATTPTTNTPAATNPATNTPNTNTSTQTTTPVVTTPTSTVVIEENKDSDGDGLTDQEEKALGTKSDVADTDTDGLTDWAEVKIYKTDPLNPDTDGDTYKDGQEVINGYDPTKPGSARLYEVPKSTTTK